MIVYSRTAAGNEAIRNPKSGLPRQLRTLLIAIDGRARLSTYVSSLSSFGDVEALIDSLLQAGLIEALASGQPKGDGRPATNQGAIVSNDSGMSTLSDGESSIWRKTDPGSTASHPVTSQFRSFSTESVNGPASRSQFQPKAAAQAFRQSSTAPETTAHYQLRSAVSHMSDFVSEHMPMEALDLILKLEGMSSVEQVIASLKGYEALIAHLGAPARQHLTELRNVLSSS